MVKYSFKTKLHCDFPIDEHFCDKTKKVFDLIIKNKKEFDTLFNDIESLRQDIVFNKIMMLKNKIILAQKNNNKSLLMSKHSKHCFG